MGLTKPIEQNLFSYQGTFMYLKDIIRGGINMIFYHELREMRTRLEKRRELVRQALMACPQGYLLKTKSAGRIEFIHIYYEGGLETVLS